MLKNSPPCAGLATVPMVRSLAVLCAAIADGTLSEERFESYKAAAGGIVCRVES